MSLYLYFTPYVFLCLCSCVCVYGASCLCMPSYTWTHTCDYVHSHGTVHLKVIGIVFQFHLWESFPWWFIISLPSHRCVSTCMWVCLCVHVCELLSFLFCCDQQLVCHPAKLNYFSFYDLKINNKNRTSWVSIASVSEMPELL